MAAQDVAAEIHGFSEPDATPTPWAAGLEQLRAADTFWLSTVRPDGRPHVTPLTAVWHAGALWFATGPEERKARNLAENPSCVLTTGRSDLVEGAPDVVRAIVFLVRPVRGLGFPQGRSLQPDDLAVLPMSPDAAARRDDAGVSSTSCARSASR
ncbi:MAG TPA: pyridoxamine 5'-phosphate oxidase family protein [Solirubrobacteraceae bacterium]|jgi:hypothetical protein